MFLDSLFGNVSPVDKSPPSNVPLRAHAYDGARGRANESDALLRKAVGELRVLAEEAVTGVDCLWNTEGGSGGSTRQNARKCEREAHTGHSPGLRSYGRPR